jgi:hypothetical protein
MARGLSGERIEKILLHNICNEIFLKLSTIHLGIVVSALAFHAGGPGSIPLQIFKLTFSPSSPSPPVPITKPSSLN